MRDVRSRGNLGKATPRSSSLTPQNVGAIDYDSAYLLGCRTDSGMTIGTSTLLQKLKPCFN
jgi:hypothetical protein